VAPKLTLPAAARWLGSALHEIDAPIVLDAIALISYPLVRIANSSLLLSTWFVTALALAVRWPASGLGIAAALAVFPQQLRFGMTPSITLIAASAIGFAIDQAVRRRTGPPIGRPLAIVTAGVVAVAVATLVATVHSLHRFEPEIGVSAALRWTELLAGLGFFLLTIRAVSRGSRRPLVLGLVGVTVALAVALADVLAPAFLPSVGFDWILAHSESSRATGPFVSPNRLGTVAAIVAIVGACRFATCSDRRRWLWAGLGVLAATLLALSFSRGALLGLVVAGAVLIATRSRRIAAAYVGVLAILALVAVPILVGARLSVSGGSVAALLENDAGRVNAWLAGIRMIAAQPIFGHGFAAFPILGVRFGATDGLQTAHNELIGLWADAGIVAAGGFVAIIVGAAGAVLQRRADPWALAALGALVVFVVASSFNVQSPFLAVMAPLWVVVAFGVGRRLDEDGLRPEPGVDAFGHRVRT
jgi:O-antigen ligase